MLHAIGIDMSSSSVWRASKPIDRALRRRLSREFHPVVMENLSQLICALESLGRVVILQLDTDISFGMGVIDSPDPELHMLAETLSVDVSFVE